MKTSHFSIIIISIFVIFLAFTTGAFAQNDSTFKYDPTLQYGSKPQTPAETHEQLHKKLVNARDAISNIMGSKMGNIPFNEVGIDEINSTLDVGIDSTKATLSEEQYLKKIKEIVGDIPIKITFEQITSLPLIMKNNPVPENNMSTAILSPLKQFKSGITANDIKCEHGLQLVIKSEDNSPSCVKSQTAQKLVERGWGWAMQPIDSLKPLLPNRIADLENDTGIVTFGNRTYYFETPHYTQDAYVNPVHISFHDVVFTLFPSGFKGGLPTNFGGVATNGCSGSYFWADAKFVDGTHKLLNIFAITTMSQHCQVLSAPTYFSTNTDPLAGLTFYDGKLKLLVSVEGKLQQNNSVFSTPIPTNETVYHDFPQPRGYSIINSTQGIIVNDDAEASNLTGFSVKSPTELPQGYKVKLIKASKEIPMVTIFVSKYPLTENATSEDFLWNQQGILITYQQTSPHELEYFKQIFTGPEDKIIRINGTLAVISDISKEYYHGYPYDMWGGLLAIQNNDTNIGIDGFFHSDELIKIATSMLEK